MLPWLPIFFLYFLQFLPLEQVVKLSAIYYLAVVFCEVPSGYVSDRFGRRVTLLLSATFMLIAYLLFVTAQGFAGLVLAELFLAGGIAFQSGSDTALHYDSLLRLGREQEYTEREAKATQYSLAASAGGCLLGGLSGTLDLVYPYYLSLLAGCVTIFFCARFVEPSVRDARTHLSFIAQLSVCARYVVIPTLFWLLCFYVAAYCLQHVVYEFYQPYIRLLNNAAGSAGDLVASSQAPFVSGLVMGSSMLAGVFGAKLGLRWLYKLGLAKLLLFALGFQTAVVTLLGFVLHPLVLVVIVTRNFSMAMARGPLLGAIGPLVDSAQRATYLSVQSLFARLAFSLSLYLLSLLLTPDAALDWPTLSTLFYVSASVGFAVILLLSLTRGCIREVDQKK